ncbi:endonuclease/exonuclease/phosphatase family protein [Streptomyces sp. McG3]|uniref:endonuclease/exonuclease/phosphatase family protein n=1 Tax=unclassified Streptomyces TaxID=2593676 RepID=UPI001BEC3F4F|nr:endonuclease/exonuclease/phosphatase family protein [Streptomyces sp. McG3]MBT2899129.1 endonuclease/exonuclease/phosphatase family protein [Streptomyces sp. McG3]
MPGRRAGSPHSHRPSLLWVAGAGVLAALVGLALGFRLFGDTQETPRTGGQTRTDAAGTLSVVTWNICGVRQWNCEDTGSAEEKKARIEALVRESGARVVLLQEMCSEDLDTVRTSLGGEWHSLFRPYTAPREGGGSITSRCTGDGRGTAGYGILSGMPLSEVTDVPLPQPAAGMRRSVLCATARKENVRICTAHLNPQQSGARSVTPELRADQLRALVEAAEGPRTVFGGDLNTGPPGRAGTGAWAQVDGPYGVYRECDQSRSSGAPGKTHRSGFKIDYLFTDLPRQECSVVRSPASDHWALLMRVTTG